MAYTTIDDPSEYFQTAIYTGNSSTLAVTSQGNADIAPDWIWIKRRSADSTHAIFDSTRGRAKSLGSEANDAEFNTSDTAKDLISFDANGFTVGPANQRNTNGNNETFVAWQWAVNGGTTTTTHSNGATNKVDDNVLQLNTTAGIAIVTYTGVEDDNGNSPIFVHNLGGVAEFVLVKNRSQDDNWAVLHKDVSASGGTKSLILNTNAAVSTSPDPFDGNPGANNGVFVKGQPSAVHEVNADGESYVAYCFRSIQGYSKIGTYTGDGSTNGVFVHTGFKPAWIIVRATDQDEWRIYDNKRANAFNLINVRLKAHAVSAESQDDNECDFVSNGIKFRSNSGGVNTGAQTYTYMCFAESPFVSSKGTPTTAR